MRLVTFRGVRPKVEPTALSPNDAQFAENCLLYGGAIRPLKSPAFVIEPVDVSGQPVRYTPGTLFPSAGKWVAFPGFVPVIKDVLSRGGEDSYLYAQDGALWRSSVDCVCGVPGPMRVGIQRPCVAPGAALTGDCTTETFPLPGCIEQYPACDDTDAPLTLTWCFTYVNCMFEESAPSPLVEPMFVGTNQGVLLIDGGVPPANATARRWYETLVGGDGSVDLFFIGETPIAQPAYQHCPSTFMPNDILQSSEYDEVPACVDGVALVGDSTTVVWNGRDIFLSEPRQPHAYPRKWQRRVDFAIKRIVTVTRNPEDNVHYHAVILTDGSPYLMDGELPEAVEVRQIQTKAPCLNPGGVTVIGDAVVFASTDGVLAIQNGNVINLTTEYMTKEQWLDHAPATVVLAYHDHRLFVFNSNPAIRSFMIPWPNPNSPYEKDMVYLSHHPTAVYHDLEFGMHITGLQGRSGVWLWEQNQQRMVATWRSQEFVQRGHWHATAAKVLTNAPRVPPDAIPWVARILQHYDRVPHADDVRDFLVRYPDAQGVLPYLRMERTLFRIYAARDLQYERPVWQDQPFRLKRDRRHVDWSFEVITTAVVHEVHVQTSMDDLTQEGGHG